MVRRVGILTRCLFRPHGVRTHTSFLTGISSRHTRDSKATQLRNVPFPTVILNLNSVAFENHLKACILLLTLLIASSQLRLQINQSNNSLPGEQFNHELKMPVDRERTIYSGTKR
jgi:hypothetical protein